MTNGAELAAWLFRIATNKALDRLRRRRLIRWLGLEGARGVGARDLVADVAERSAVERALAALKPEDAVCLLLHAPEGLSHAEIGEVLGISAGAAQKRVSRAKEAFRRAYRREEDA